MPWMENLVVVTSDKEGLACGSFRLLAETLIGFRRDVESAHEGSFPLFCFLCSEDWGVLRLADQLGAPNFSRRHDVSQMPHILFRAASADHEAIPSKPSARSEPTRLDPLGLGK